jgi:hypothetical protein
MEVDIIVAPIDKRNVGENNVPVTKVPINDFEIATIYAPLKSPEVKRINTIIFANPNFKKGRGLGINASKTNKVDAKEA